MIRYLVALLVVLTVLLGSCSSESGRNQSAPTATTETGPENSSNPVMLIIGDSLSMGVAACGSTSECRERSWVGGTDVMVNSIASRVEQSEGSRPRLLWSVRQGARVAGVKADIEQLGQTAVGAHPSELPSLITLSIGATDACANLLSEITSPQDFESGVSSLLRIISDAAPEAEILILSVPNLSRIWEINNDNPNAIEAWRGTRSCASLLEPSMISEDQRNYNMQRIDDAVASYNVILDNECSLIRNCIYDGGSLFDFSFTPNDISTVDFFHPSAEGQRKIAALAWDALSADG